MGEAMRIVIMMLAGGVLLVVCVTAGLFAASLALSSEEKVRREQLRRMENSHVVKGTFTDRRMTGGENGLLRRYAYAISYEDDSRPHCALIGISTEIELPFQIGDSIELRVADKPLIDAEPAAENPSRAAEGKLPPEIGFRSWMGKAVDERGRLMLEMDYQAMKENVLRKSEQLRKASFALLFASGIAVICGYSWLRTYFR